MTKTKKSTVSKSTASKSTVSKNSSEVFEKLKALRLELMLEKTIKKEEPKKESKKEEFFVTIPASLGCQQTPVQHLVEGIFKALEKSGVKVDAKVVLEIDKDKRTDDKYEVGMVVVPLNNPNGHNYPIGKPCLVTHTEEGGNSWATRMNGGTGNCLPAFNYRNIRRATKEEIELFVSKFDSVVII
jgi:hypothetical protein